MSAGRGRIVSVGVVLALVACALVGRAVQLMVVKGDLYARRADVQHSQAVTLTPQRGEIVDRDGDLLALSLDVPSIYLRPRQLGAAKDRLADVAKALHMPLARVQALAARTEPFVWLKRQALPRELAAVQSLELPGIGHFAEPRRVYPHGALAAHLLGFVGTDANGLGGIEKRFDREIRGEPRRLEVGRDARGREFLTQATGAEPIAGSRVELTIDDRIQDVVERELEAGVQNVKAAGGAAVVLEPATGEILALANYPTFDPNDPRQWGDPKLKDHLRNRALTDPYEPGSTFKAVLAAAALEEKVVDPADRIFCENGAYQIGKWTVNDAHPHGWLSFAEVIQYSSNIGCSKVADRLGRERYYDYLRKFGFGQRSGVELPGETAGILRDGKTWARIDLAVQSFGQGVSVTPLQMVAAYGAIANGGLLMRPYLVRRVVGPTGEVQRETQPTALRRVIREQTAHTTTELLRRVVEEKGGTGSKARLDDYPVAGKTGTAQKVDPNGRGYSSKRIGSFVGYVPADAPRAVILVLIDEPTTAVYGGVVAAPVFKAIAEQTMKIMGVEPRRTVEEPAPSPLQQAKAAPAKAGAVRKAVALPAAAPEPAIAVMADDAPATSGTPSFLGMSLREALTRAQQTGFAVEVRGSGWVAEQDPRPGAPLAAERRLALVLRTERDALQP
jgi:cell division protein FtsI (penicillin-binding protein 3)